MYIRLQYIEFSSATPLGVDKFQTEGLLRTKGFEDELHEIRRFGVQENKAEPMLDCSLEPSWPWTNTRQITLSVLARISYDKHRLAKKNQSPCHEP